MRGPAQHGDAGLVDPAAGIVGREPERQALGSPVDRDDVGLEQPARRRALGARAQARLHAPAAQARALGGDVEVELALAQEMGHEPRKPPTQTRPSRSTSGAARFAVTLPAIRPEPSGAMRPRDAGVGAGKIDDVEGFDRSAGPSDRIARRDAAAPGRLPGARRARRE